MNEPLLGKSNPRPDDYKPLTEDARKKIKKAAQKAANKFGYSVYLVGSATYKEIPRDIDISVIMPLRDYEEWFGSVPKTEIEVAHYGEYLLNVFHKSFEYIKDLHFCIDYHLDIKVCPDTWWVEKPKILLAKPKNKYK